LSTRISPVVTRSISCSLVARLITEFLASARFNATQARGDRDCKINSFDENISPLPHQHPINAQGAIFWQAAQSEVMRQGKRRFLSAIARFLSAPWECAG